MSFVKCAGRQHGRRVELCVSVSVLALIAFAAGGNPSVAQEQQQQQQQQQQGTPETAPSTQPLRPVNVSAPRPRRQVNRPAPRGAPGRARPQPTVARPVEPTTTTPITGILPPVTSTAVGPLSPLDGNVVTESGSRLGIPARDIPATVNVVDQQMIREQGYRTTTEAMQGVPGVTAGDGPGAPGSISMRGFSGSQINTLYNGIKIGPSDMTNRIMDTFTLDRVEVLKGPASLMSGEGATGGAVNYVNKAPHTGPVVNEIFAGWDSFNGYRAGFGSGGSTGLKGLDYRFDVSRNFMNGFIDDTYTKLTNISGQLNYQVTSDLKLWIAAEHKEDQDRFYWGTPIVPANFPGVVPTKGIVSGLWTQYYPGPGDFDGHVGALGPATIDARTLKTTYNVLDNRSGAQENWLRGGFEYAIAPDLKLRSQAYGYEATRNWFNNEVNAFNDSGNPTLGDPGQIFRERLTVNHNQHLYGGMTDLAWNTNFAGMENRAVASFGASSLQFNVMQDDFFFEDAVDLVNPNRGFYGPQALKPFLTHLNDIYMAFEDRIKLTPTFALLGGIRFDEYDLSRTAYDVDGILRSADGYPFEKRFTPTTGRVGYTWEFLPGLTWYSQYATAADPAVANIFIIRPTQPLQLTTTRTIETGVKELFWNNRAEITASVYDIVRNNVYESKSGHRVDVASQVHAKGFEFAGAIKPIDGWKLWGNVAVVDSKYENFVDADTGQSFNGMTPPNVPRIIANVGSSYTFATRWPIEVGGVIRHVGDRFNNDDNLVVMDAYTIADAYAFVDIDGRDLPWRGIDKTRLTFRVRNLTNKQYAVWGDPGYPDQVLLGAPRSYEVSASFKF